METIIRRCAGLDVHKASVVACVRAVDENGELQTLTQSFGTTTGDLLKLNDWLMSYAVTVVGMESTGAYWRHRLLHVRASVVKYRTDESAHTNSSGDDSPTTRRKRRGQHF